MKVFFDTNVYVAEAILRAALAAGADYLVSNDAHLLVLNPYHGLRIVSIDQYYQLLIEEGLLL